MEWAEFEESYKRTVSRKNVLSNKKKDSRVKSIHKKFTLMQSNPSKRKFKKYKVNLIDSWR